MKLIRQHDERDCGAACLSMIASFYGLYLPITKFREITRTDFDGTNLYGLVDGAAKIGLSGEALEGSPEELKKEIESGKIRFPFVAHIVSEQGRFHFVVVAGIRWGKIQIFDPGKGKHRIPASVFFSQWTGYLVTFEKTPQFHPGNETTGSLKRFFSLLQGQSRNIIGILLFSVIIAGIGMAGSFVFKIMLDDHGSISENSLFNYVFISLIILYLTQAIMHVIRGWLIARLTRSIDVQLSLSYYRHLLKLPLADILSRSTGEYLSRLSDTTAIRTAVSAGILTLVLDTVMAVAGGILLYLQSSRLFLISCSMILLYLLVALLYRRPLKKSNQTVMENKAVVQAFFKESVDGIEAIKAYHANGSMEDRFSYSFQKLIRSEFRNDILTTTQESIVTAIEMIGTVLILWAGFSLTFHGGISVGSLMTFYALLSFFTEPIKNLIALQPMLQTAIVAAERLNDVLDTEEEKTTDPKPLNKIVAPLNLLGVSFRYSNYEMTLKNIDLLIEQGERVAIVGESGCGKTTLAKLIMKFYAPERGEIIFNATRLKQVERTDLSNSIAYVSPNATLFSGTVRSNLLLAKTDATEEEIISACKLSLIHDYISAMPFGYDTPIEEKGINLSSGQRQRLAIAQAIIKKPKLLILDEATESLDLLTESKVLKNIFLYDLELTCIMVSHRLSSIAQCNRIVVMKDGSIVENGTHEALLSNRGAYYRLWKAQLGDLPDISH